VETLDLFLLIGALLLVLAMPIASVVVRALDLVTPETEAGPLVFLATLIPAGLILLACILRMNTRLYSEDWGQIGALYFAYGAVPLSLLLGAISAALTLRRVRRDREE
jgi:hypothetical protein